MLSISDLFKNNTFTGYVTPACKAVVELKNGDTLELTDEDLLLGGFVIQDSVSGSGTFDIGQVITNELKLYILNDDEKYSGYDFIDAKITAWRGGKLYKKDGLVDKDTTEMVQCGIFTVEEYKAPDTQINLRCYDNISKTEEPYASVNINYPATIQRIVQDICTYCGLTLATSAIDFGSYVIDERPDDEAMTCRDMLGYCAQICGCYVRCNTSGEVEYKWYEVDAFADDSTIPVHEISALRSFDPAAYDIVITGIRVEDGDRDSEEASLYGEDGYVLEISDNPLITSEAVSTIAEHLGKKIVGMTFRAMDLSCFMDWSIEAGDPIRITDRKGKEYPGYCTNLVYKHGDAYQISCDAETPADRALSRYSSTTKAIVDLRRKIREEKTERDIAIENMAAKLANSSGFYITAEEQADGSNIYYMHDKRNLAESVYIWKITMDAIAISSDGGQTYPYGLDLSGAAILDRIYAVGINANYITTGAFTVQDEDGNVVFSADKDTGRVVVAALTSFQNELGEYLRIDPTDESVSIGSTKNPVVLKIINNRIAFMLNDEEIAYFSNNQLYVSQLVVTSFVDLCGIRISKSGNIIRID